jgi:hypothetical protein
MFIDDVIYNAVFVCSHCKRLTLITRDLWTSDSAAPDAPSAPRRRAQSHLLGPSAYALRRDLGSWRFRTSYQQMLGDFGRRQCAAFPLCSGCIGHLCPRWRYEAAYLAEQTAYLARVAVPDALARYAELERANARLRNDVCAFREVARQYSAEIERIARPAPAAGRAAEERARPAGAAAPRSAPPAPAAPPFPGLAFASAYRIATRRHYGCINDNRLGTGSPDAVPPDEVDRALFFVAHMVQALGRLARVETPALSVGTTVALRTERDGALVLTAADLRSGRGQRAFCAATAALVEILNQIFESQLFAESNFSPPHRIDTAKAEISGDKYLYEKARPAVFTSAMKHLLFSLKYTQKWALQAAVSGLAESE